MKTLWKLGSEAIGAIKGVFKAGKEVEALESTAAAAVHAERNVVEAMADSCPIGNSFLPDTPVLMADGTTKPIGQVHLGDRVLASDPRSGKTIAEPVAATITGEGIKHLVDLTIDGHVVTATEGHPLWAANRGRWIIAGHVQAGDQLLTPSGALAHVTAVRAWTALARVNNLGVARLHTYYVRVGTELVLVHNCGGPVRLSEDRLATHVLPRHGSGTPSNGTKFHSDLDPDDFESLANEAVTGSPSVSRHDAVTGNHAHDHDFGPGRVIGENGSTRMRVWVDPNGNVQTMHPL